MKSVSATAVLSVLLVVSAIVLLHALTIGSVTTDFASVWNALWGDAENTQQRVILELRWPRAASAFAVGGMLALAGTMMQVLLRNPLADPYILGISGGASVGALVSMLLGLGTLWLNAGAFTGALLSMLLVFGIAHGHGSWTSSRLLLTGVVVAFAWGAVISFILSVAPEQQLRNMLFWLMGDLSFASSSRSLWLLLIGLLLAMPLARTLNVMLKGDLQAAALGVSIRPTRFKIYLLASVLTSLAVTTAGSIGFIGLVVPHMLRLLTGSDHRTLLPASALLGGLILVFADSLARSVIAPQQLPVGVLTAFLGVPLFLYLLQRGNRITRHE
ncbi:MAG: iron ABC transporter permease [Gammaproteobacteria bacterium]|nr:MAG: iron ABC transporter permease [Gammaproteobacteria bacterium]